MFNTINLYKSYIFYYCWPLLLMYFGCYGKLKFPLTCNGKSEIGIYCCLVADILAKVFQKCLLTSPVLNI